MKIQYSKISAIIAVFSLACLQSFAQRTEQIIDFGWKFHLGNVVSAEQVEFNDVGWESVDLPHDFQISQPWVAPSKDEKEDKSDPGANIKSRLSSRGFKEMGIGWYRYSFTPDESWKSQRTLIDFGGIMYVADVYLNGKRIGGTEYGYLGFEIDITKDMVYGQKNVIAVKANTQRPENSRWYTGGGLIRDVKMIHTSTQQYFTRHPLYITTNDNVVNLQASMAYMTGAKEPFNVEVTIADAEGKTVASHINKVNGNRRQKSNAEYKLDSMVVENPHLWDCENPYLYNICVKLYNSKGELCDEVNDRFGFRKIEYAPEYGFKLNGKKVLLKGIANHHSLGALGAAAYPKAIYKRLKLLKSFGVNHVRTSHNPYSEDFLRICDELGILVVDELYDKWLTQYTGGRTEWTQLWQEHIPEFITRDRNHPSVVMWSLGNELQTYPQIPYGDYGVTAFRLQKPLVMRYDSTRPVTVAMHPRGRNEKTDSLPCNLAMETDIQAYNYRYMYFPGDGRRFPWMNFYQSEANTSGMGPNFFEMDLSKVIGLAYWGMIDYLGESNGWPAKGWAQGMFDISLQPKPIAYFLKSYFKDEEPTVHIGIIENTNSDVLWNDVQVGTKRMTENWNRKDGEECNVVTFTNADEVELFQNGRSLGVRQNEKKNPKARNKISWGKVKYKEGNLVAVARTNGKEVARDMIETTGEATSLKVFADDDMTWKADGMDLQYIRVYAIDKKGRRVLSADDLLTFEVEGDARIVAVDNGDMNSNELHTGTTRTLYQGSAQVVLRAGLQGG
ncbi:MAG: glycoside hydrolase family 2 TIM barrel-domain containing protein, partial [Prevotellaceae bacterium]|nr:glycoside hydrolase family 2 TIM barrel-domain containing protein [Prevotellaceae bacterium]